MTATRSHSRRTTARSWAMKIIARFILARSSIRRLMICAWIDTSSAETHSSATMSFGSTASARAMPTRWHWPPDSVAGLRTACSGSRPTSDSSSATRLPVSCRADLAMDPQHFGDRFANPHARVEGIVGVLEDHRRFAAQRRASRRARSARRRNSTSAAGDLGQAENGAAPAWSCRSPTRRRAPAFRPLQAAARRH